MHDVFDRSFTTMHNAKAWPGLGWTATVLGLCYGEVGEIEMVARLDTQLPHWDDIFAIRVNDLQG